MVRAKPFLNRARNMIEIFNEIIIMLTQYSIFFMTDFVGSAEIKNFAGMFTVYAVAVNITVNLSIVV
jgi:hypothetical protein